MKQKKKTGPKPYPLAKKRRHAVMVRFCDAELLALKAKAEPKPVATYMRDVVLAS